MGGCKQMIGSMVASPVSWERFSRSLSEGRRCGSPHACAARVVVVFSSLWSTMLAAVAFSLAADGSVAWVTVGLRCRRDGAMGLYTGWKIDYRPTEHLMTMV